MEADSSRLSLRSAEEFKPVTRCLLANDNSYLLMAYQETLKPHFDQVDVANNGLEALEAVQRH